jgi:hypothetical protein
MDAEQYNSVLYLQNHSNVKLKNKDIQTSEMDCYFLVTGRRQITSFYWEPLQVRPT